VTSLSPVYANYVDFQRTTGDRTFSFKFKAQNGVFIAGGNSYITTTARLFPLNDIRIGLKVGAASLSFDSDKTADAAVKAIHCALADWDKNWPGFRLTNVPGYTSKLSHLTYRLWSHGRLFGFQIVDMDEKFRTKDAALRDCPNSWATQNWNMTKSGFTIRSLVKPELTYELNHNIIGLRGTDRTADDSVAYFKVEGDTMQYRRAIIDVLATWDKEWMWSHAQDASAEGAKKPECFGNYCRRGFDCQVADCSARRECCEKYKATRATECANKKPDCFGTYCKKDGCTFSQCSFRFECRLADEAKRTEAPKCNLKYELWAVENVVMFRILEQNTFLKNNFLASNGIGFFIGEGHREPIYDGFSLFLPSGKSQGEIACRQCNNRQDAADFIKRTNQAFKEWGESIRNGGKPQPESNIHEV